MRTPHPYHLMPHYAKCAIELLECQSDRSIAKLNTYIDHYAKAMGQLVDEQTRFSAHAIAIRRFAPGSMDTTGSLAAWTDVESPTTNYAGTPTTQNAGGESSIRPEVAFALGDAVMLRSDLYKEPDEYAPGGYLARRGEKLIVREVREGLEMPIAVSHETRTDGNAFMVRSSELEPWKVISEDLTRQAA